MKHLAAYLLLELAGTTPNAKEIQKLLKTVGIEADDARLKSLLNELDGKDINQLISEGTSKLASVPSGGSGGVAASGGGGAGGAKEEAPAEEVKEEEKDESDDDMGLGLFD